MRSWFPWLPAAALLAPGCAHEMTSPTPQADGLDPSVVCGEQLVTPVAVRGSGLSPVVVDALTDEPALRLPRLTLKRVTEIAGETVSEEAVWLDDGAGAAHVRWIDDATMEFDVYPELGLLPGIYDFEAGNADGQTAAYAAGLAVVPPPVIDSAEPGMICTAQFDNVVQLTGSGFLVLGGILPTVEVGESYSVEASAVDGCVDLAVQGGGGESCTVLTFSVPEGAVADGAHDIVVTNPAPANCQSSDPVLVEVVPPPVLDGVDPDTFCLDQGDQQIELTGEDFLSIDGTLPTVTIGPHDFVADTVDGCLPLTTPGAQTCMSLTVTLAQGSLIDGVYDVTVTNPIPAACASSEPVELEVTPPPSLVSIEPDVACTEQADTFYALSGADFLVLDGQLPTVDVGGAHAAPADSADGCTSLDGPSGGESCTSLAFTIPTAAVAAGLHDVTVTNPSPAGCATVEVVQLEVIPPPAVLTVSPGGICTEALDTTVTITGTDFLFLAADCTDSALCPEIALGTEIHAPVSFGGCISLSVPTGGQLCTSLDVEVLEGTFIAVGSHPVQVTNPGSAGCGSNVDVTFDVTDPPVIDSVDPPMLCETGGAVTLYGTGVQSGAQVYAGATPASFTTWISDTEIDASFGAMSTGWYDVTLVNPDGCEDTLPAAVEVVHGPAMYFVDPPVIYSEMTTVVSIYVGSIYGNVVDVQLEHVDSGTFYAVNNFTYDGANTIFAEIEALNWSLAEGDYRVYVTDDTSCTPFLESALYVEEDLLVALVGIDPSFGWELEGTPVDIWAADAADLAVDEVQFVDLPRVYLNPTTGSAASSLVSLSYRSEKRLNAVVPAGLPVGDYDVIVVNPPPGNEIGLLPAAFTVTASAPPVIDSVSPMRVDSSAETDVVINGDNFNVALFDMNSVQITCLEPSQTETTVSATAITSASTTAIEARLPSDQFATGTVCVVRVTNIDGSYYDYSAISVGSASGNLFDWYYGTDLITARRAPACLAGRSTERSRYIYAIGGDDGTAAGAYATIEVADLDAYGNMEGWEELPGQLPTPITLAGVATVGRFVYLVGGNDGLGPLDTVMRAQILDPLAAPQFDSLNLDYGGGMGLDGGTWIYRVSAVLDAADPVNPGGESLASDPVVATLPFVPDLIHLTIAWTKVPDAVSYNIYRSPVADAGSGLEELLTNVPDDGIGANTTQSFLDTGYPTTPSYEPLPKGSLGEWATVATLPGGDALDAAREAPAVVVAQDPVEPTTAYLYVAGGLDGYGVYRDTIHYVDITGEGETVGSWSTSANVLADARCRLGGFLVDNTYHSVVGPGETWIYFANGMTAAGASSGTEAGTVDVGGELVWSGAVASLTPGRHSYSYLSANNYLYVIGGARPASPAMSDGKETEMTGPPGLGGWSNLGGSTLNEPRALPGSAIESAVVFSVGGVDAGGTALFTTEYTNF